MRTRVLIAAAFCFLASDAVCQAVRAISPEVHNFNSPMVLEYGLDDVFKSQSPTVVPEFREFSCRGVTLERVTLQLVRFVTRFKEEPFRRLKIVSEVFNNSGKDKRATIAFALVRAGDVIATETLAVKVQQGDFAKSSAGRSPSAQEVTVPIPANLDVEPYPKLRITMTLTDY